MAFAPSLVMAPGELLNSLELLRQCACERRLLYIAGRSLNLRVRLQPIDAVDSRIQKSHVVDLQITLG